MRLISKLDSDTLADHWATRRGRTRPSPEPTWYLTFPNSPELHAFARRASASIADLPHLVPVEVDWLHATLVRPGAAAELRGKDALTDLPTAPADPMVLDQLLVFDEGLAVIGASPAWQAWLNAARAHLSIDNPDPHVWFHISLGYATGPQPAADLIAQLHPLLEDSKAIPIGRPSLVLAELIRAPQAYRWRPLVELDL